MFIAINATRMELLKLRRRLAIAQRGHKLLKDKQEELMRQMLHYIAEIKQLRKNLREELQKILASLYIAQTQEKPLFLESALFFSKYKIEVILKPKPILNVKVFELIPKIEEEKHFYGFYQTSGELDIVVRKLKDFLSNLLKLAELMKTLELLGQEMEKVRRRVNALEYRLIPALLFGVRYIQFKLSEGERESLMRILRIKEILRK